MDQLGQLQLLLRQTQASLVLSFEKEQNFRLRNKQIREELSQLRQQVHAGSRSAIADPERVKSTGERQPGTSNVSDRSGTQYIFQGSDKHPVTIVNEDRTVSNIIVSDKFVDFVESKARIASTTFVGITNVALAERQRGGFMCCFSPASGPYSVNGDEDDGPSASGRGTGALQITWNKDHTMQRIVLETSAETRQCLHKHTQRWLGVDSDEAPPGDEDIVPPKGLLVGSLALQVSGEASQLLSADHLKALASAVPAMERLRPWRLKYSTKRHGISLATLYRMASGQGPTLLIVRDTSGYIFGCYTGDGWRIAPCFYGSGETFVFQLEPHKVMYSWRHNTQAKNDLFQFATPERLAVGGLGSYAIHLDSELLQGSSGTCGTFGSPCLSGLDEFKVSMIEVWQAAQ